MNAAQVLKTYFGYDSFRKGQEDIIEAVLSGRDALAVMPTGAGKSVCYQVPALLLPGITLVISPLISLMQDQVKSLNESGIHAAYINSALSEAQISRALELAERGTYKIIYVAPERLESAGFLRFARNVNISMVTVDEAHCISQWGQDFRPSYLKIIDFIEQLPGRPVISAFTATATEEVKTDIECVLRLHDPKNVVTGFDRENLYYSVEHRSGKQKDRFVIDYLEKHPNDSGIIYCATRKNVDTLYEELTGRNIPVTSYHAGIDNETRKRNQDDFIYDRKPVIVATNAFGMGINKSNVRFVIHYNMPQSMENYYQEAGRAGRDGDNARCILLFSPQDVIIDQYLLEKKEYEGMNEADIELVQQKDAQRLYIMERYCKTTSCLRNYILNYFGEKTGARCENCGNCDQEYTEVDMTPEAKWMINCIAETRGRYGRNIVIGTLLGADGGRLREIGADSYRSYGALSNRTENELRLLLDQLLAEGYVIQTDGKYSVLQMGDITRLKNEETRVIVRKREDEKAEAAGKSKSRKQSTHALTRAGYELFDRLRQLRLVIAKEEAVPPYIIFDDRTLADMCAKAPADEPGMRSVSGVGEYKFHKYGQRFLDEVRGYLKEHPGAVLSIPSEGTKETGTSLGGWGKKQKKGPFYLNPEDAGEFAYAEYLYSGEIRDRLNAVCSVENVKKASFSEIWSFLLGAGLTEEEEQDGNIVKNSTSKGLEAGIRTENKVNQYGKPYQVLQYPEKVQRMIVESFVGPRVEGTADGPLKTGKPWDGEETEQLRAEFQAGMKVQEIARRHGRTGSAVSAKLQKMGLIE